MGESNFAIPARAVGSMLACAQSLALALTGKFDCGVLIEAFLSRYTNRRLMILRGSVLALTCFASPGRMVLTLPFFCQSAHSLASASSYSFMCSEGIWLNGTSLSSIFFLSLAGNTLFACTVCTDRSAVSLFGPRSSDLCFFHRTCPPVSSPFYETGGRKASGAEVSASVVTSALRFAP